MGYFVCAPGRACIDDNIIANDEEEEELVDRYEHEFEKSVDDFLDEDFRGQKTIMESSDEEEDFFVAKVRRMRKLRRHTKRGNSHLLWILIQRGCIKVCSKSFSKKKYVLSKMKNIVQDRCDNEA